MITVIANLKGGSGKSTVAFNLGLWLQVHGQPTVAYDLDPQCTLLDASGVRREEGYAPPLQVYHGDENLAQHLHYHPGEVLVDVGAANLVAMKEAIRNSHRVLIPVSPSQPDVWATQRFLKIVDDAIGDAERPEMVVFLNRADTNPAVRETDETAEALAQLPGVKLLPQRLYQRTIYRRSFSEGMAVFELWASSKGALEFGEFARALYPNYQTRKRQVARMTE